MASGRPSIRKTAIAANRQGSREPPNMLLTGHTIRETLPFPMVRPAESTPT
jgi:hypothetical protein